MRVYQVDSFTEIPFRGNPAAVCVLDKQHSDDWMLQVAAEMNLSETAFVLKEDEVFSLRWFTPTTEVDLCGHATLATAHVLWSEGFVEGSERIEFMTRSGKLTASLGDGWISLDFPAEVASPVEVPLELLESLGIDKTSFAGRNRFDYILEIDSAEQVRNLQPDFSTLASIAPRGVIVTSQSDSEQADFVSRFFCPAIGVDEDPVTGSAHCCLAPYWHTKLGKTHMVGYQASKRGGIVKVSIRGDRVILQGKAVTVLKGTLLS